MAKVFNHYVPQFYLKNFSNDNTHESISKKETIGMYFIDEKLKEEYALINENAGVEYLYGHTEKIENQLSKYESRWAPIVRKIIDTEEIFLNKKERKLILKFFWISESRTKYVTDYIKNSLKQFEVMLEKSNIPKKPNVEDTEEHVIFESYLEEADSIVEVSNDLELVLIKNETNIDFLTSDCPMVKYNSLFMKNDYIISYNYAQIGFQSFFPISPKICLLLYDKKVYSIASLKKGKIIISNDVDIENMNRLFIYNANNILFFKDFDERILKNYLVVKDQVYSNQIKEPFKDGKITYIPFNTPGVYKRLDLSFFKINNKYLDINLKYSTDGPLRSEVKKILERRMV